MNLRKILTNLVPKVLAIIYIIFIVLLSLDVFNLNGSFFEKIGGFAIENIPTVFLLIALFFAWKKPAIGGSMFLVVSIIFTLFFKTYQKIDTFILISFPLLLIGGLFLLNKSEHN